MGLVRRRFLVDTLVPGLLFDGGEAAGFA